MPAWGQGQEQYPFPPQMPIHRPYYIPPYAASMETVMGLPMEVVDERLRAVRIKDRPGALKFTINCLIFLFIICISYTTYLFANTAVNFFTRNFFSTLSLLMAMMSFAALILLYVPKKVGWFFAFTVSIMGLPIFVLMTFVGFVYQPLYGTPIGTLSGLLTSILMLISLMLSSNRFYFHTGSLHPGKRFPARPYPYPYSYPNTPANQDPMQYPNQNEDKIK